MAMMTEEHKEIDKKKIEDKEKIKKMEDLLKRTHQQIHTLVKFRHFYPNKLSDWKHSDISKFDLLQIFTVHL